MDLEEKIALYALGALEPAEAGELESLASASPDLSARLAEARVMLSALALDPEPIAPSPALKQRLTTRIEAELTPLQQRLDSAARPRPEPRPAASKLAQLLRSLAFGLAAVTSVAALAFGISLTRTQSQLATARNETATLQTELAAARQQIVENDTVITALRSTADQLRGELALVKADLDEATRTAALAQGAATEKDGALVTAQSQVDLLQSQLSVISLPNVRSATLPASNETYGKGAITVFFSPEAKQALIAVSNLPPLPKDLCYQLWLIQDNNALPSIVLNTDASGSGRSLVPADLTFGNYQLLGITVEKAGGSPTPNPEGPVFLGPIG